MASAFSDDEIPALELQAAREELSGRMIDAWIASHGNKSAPWRVAVVIVCVISRLPDSEMNRLLALDD